MSSSLFNPDYLLYLCKKYGLAPSKKYGQNFLVDPGVIEAIIAAADIGPADTVVEVGPGFGVLTLPLAARAQRVISFEIEKKLQPYWEEAKNKRTNVEIIWGNVLREFDRFCHSAPDFTSVVRMTSPYKVVANLPYQITSPVIRLFLEAKPPPGLSVLTVQKEVAERICARPGGMSLLSVAVQYYADAEIVAAVPRSAFWPAPKVDSAVVRITARPRPAPPLKGEGFEGKSLFNKFFFTLVKAGFSNRRKFLLKNILPIFGKEDKARLAETFFAAHLTPQARAQELSVGEWLELARAIYLWYTKR